MRTAAYAMRSVFYLIQEKKKTSIFLCKATAFEKKMKRTKLKGYWP
jgi:hypothetical protein